MQAFREYQRQRLRMRKKQCYAGCIYVPLREKVRDKNVAVISKVYTGERKWLYQMGCPTIFISFKLKMTSTDSKTTCTTTNTYITTPISEDIDTSVKE